MDALLLGERNPIRSYKPWILSYALDSKLCFQKEIIYGLIVLYE